MTPFKCPAIVLDLMQNKRKLHVLCSSIIFRIAVGLNFLYFAIYYSWHHMSPRCLLPFHVTSFSPSDLPVHRQI